jgi:hypothetical protein
MNRLEIKMRARSMLSEAPMLLNSDSVENSLLIGLTTLLCESIGTMQSGVTSSIISSECVAIITCGNIGEIKRINLR